MTRVAYAASTKQFIYDWDTNTFMSKMREGAALNHIGGSPSEVKSWNENGAKMRSLLALAAIPDDVEIAFEYKSPLTGRVDCMLFGYGSDKKKHIVHIELKQWSNDTVTQLYDTGVFKVTALVGGKYQVLSHPSQQAFNYQQNILNYVPAADASDTELDGCAYCYNYTYSGRPNDLFAEQYKPIMSCCPLHSGDQVRQFARDLKDVLAGGEGTEIFKEFISSPIRPTKNLMDAAANMFKGKEEFVLLDEQLTSSNLIFGMVEKAIKNPDTKMALIVKGGPGTGKTVIALHVIAELAQKYPYVNALFATRSKALRNTLREKLNHIPTATSTSAAGLIRDIYDFKPCHFSEGEVDVLLIDEAHRIMKSSNVMYDRKSEQTYLTQVMSLLYCSKICVFFIDDHQSVNNKEIGLSSEIEVAGREYNKRIISETEQFKQRLMTYRQKLAEVYQKVKVCTEQKQEMDEEAFEKRMTAYQKKIQKYKEELSKSYQLDDVHVSVRDVDVMSIELKSQFRCNGSDNYLDWLDGILYDNWGVEKSSQYSFMEDYLFEVCDTPAELEKKIRALNGPKDNPKQVARLAAGYCWSWSDKLQPDGDLAKDVTIGDWSMPWETKNVQAQKEFNKLYAPSADLWASHPMGINQVGCIFSAQGFEVDYIGVIIGPDMKYDPYKGRIVTEKGHTHSVSDADPNFDAHIRNIYRVLLSRGRKGCLVYCCDQNLNNFLHRLSEAQK